MKVGLVLDTTLDSDAGVQQYFKGLGRFLLKNGHDIRFIVPPSDKTKEFQGKILSFGKNIVVKGNANTVPTTIHFGYKDIREAVIQENFDIIHISAPFSPFLGSKVLKYSNCPIVSSYMIYGKSSLFRKGVSLLKIFMNREYKKISVHIAPSDAAKSEAEKTIPGEYKIIPLAIDVEKYSRKGTRIEKYDDGKINILTIGRLEERKGTEYLIKAFKKIKEVEENTRLIIVGDGPRREELESLVHQLSLPDVNFEGYINESKKADYLTSGDICVYPSIYGESFGIVLVEALASGKVTIAFSNEGYKYVLRNLPLLLVKNKDINQLSERILRFIRDNELRETYSRKCEEEVEKYSWNEIGKRVVEVYKSLLSNS